MSPKQKHALVRGIVLGGTQHNGVNLACGPASESLQSHMST